MALGPKQLPSQLVLGAVSLLMNWPERKADNSPLCGAKIKHKWSYTSLPVYAFMTFTEATSLDFHLTFLYVFLIHCYGILASLYEYV